MTQIPFWLCNKCQHYIKIMNGDGNISVFVQSWETRHLIKQNLLSPKFSDSSEESLMVALTFQSYYDSCGAMEIWNYTLSSPKTWHCHFSRYVMWFLLKFGENDLCSERDTFHFFRRTTNERASNPERRKDIPFSNYDKQNHAINQLNYEHGTVSHFAIPEWTAKMNESIFTRIPQNWSMNPK